MEISLNKNEITSNTTPNIQTNLPLDIIHDNSLHKINIILICGIPGAGKSYLISNFLSYLKKLNYNTISLSFDNIFFDHALNNNVSDANSSNINYDSNINNNRSKDIKDNILDFEKWKESQIMFKDKFKEDATALLNSIKNIDEKDGKDSKETYFIVEDNFFYKSFRKPFYNFVKEHILEARISYLEIHLKCSQEYAKSNNDKRKHHEKFGIKLSK